MAVRLDHTIVHATDADRSAAFFADVLGLPQPKRIHHFRVVQTDDGVSFDFADSRGPIQVQHYAFALDADEWEASFARVQALGVPYWADPYRHRPGVVDTSGGRRIYFEDPDGHFLEIVTTP